MESTDPGSGTIVSSQDRLPNLLGPGYGRAMTLRSAAPRNPDRSNNNCANNRAYTRRDGDQA